MTKTELSEQLSELEIDQAIIDNLVSRFDTESGNPSYFDEIMQVLDSAQAKIEAEFEAKEKELKEQEERLAVMMNKKDEIISNTVESISNSEVNTQEVKNENTEITNPQVQAQIPAEVKVEENTTPATQMIETAKVVEAPIQQTPVAIQNPVQVAQNIASQNIQPQMSSSPMVEAPTMQANLPTQNNTAMQSPNITDLQM